MNPRYFVTYRNLKSKQTEPVEVLLGRYYDPEEAQRRGGEAYDVEGYVELVSVRPETAIEARVHHVSRFFIRVLRIVCAGALALFAFSWLSGSGGTIGDVPFSSLTLNMLFSNLFKIALSIGAWWLCWFIAFGDGPER